MQKFHVESEYYTDVILSGKTLARNNLNKTLTM